MVYGKFALSERACFLCKKSDLRWKDRTYQLVRFNERGDVAHPRCLIQEHGEAKAQELVPKDEWAKRATS